jgi:hypothetical protein
MRKLTEVLPIVRRRLPLANESRVNDSSSHSRDYTCFCAAMAATAGEITDEEFDALTRAIRLELQRQANTSAISGIACHHHISVANLRNPEYVAFRDKWLDAFQAKLGEDGPSFEGEAR